MRRKPKGRFTARGRSDLNRAGVITDNISESSLQPVLQRWPRLAARLAIFTYI